MKKKAVLIASCGLLLLMLLTACAPAATPSAGVIRGDTVSSAPAAPAQPNTGAKAANSFAVPNVANAQTDTNRLVVRNADLSIVVKDPGASMDAISQMATGMGGYVVSSRLFKVTNSEGVEIPQASITVRVPVDRLNEALGKIKAEVSNKDTDILAENVTGQDITKEYTDLQSRLTNLENAEQQLQKIMDQATKTDDVLAVYNQLVSVREQIEVLKGQIKYYDESAALSAISVTLQSQAAVKPLTIGGWKPVGDARNAIQALINTMQFIGTALIWIILFILPVVIVLVLIFLVVRFFWRKVFKPRKPKTPLPIPPTPPTGPSSQE